MKSWWFQRHVAQRACLVLGLFLTVVFVGLMTLLPLLTGRIPSDLDEMPLRDALASPAVLLPVLSLAVLAGGFIRSRWVLPAAALVLAALLINWHRQFGSVALAVPFIAGVGVLAWAGWSQPHFASAAAGVNHSAVSSAKLLSIAMAGMAAAALLFVLVGFAS